MSNATLARVQGDTSSDTVESTISAIWVRNGEPIREKSLDAILTVARDALTEADALSQSVAEKSSAITALTESRDAEEARRQTRSVLFSRVAYLVTTAEVRGVVSMARKEFADAMGVTPQRITQAVTVGRALTQAVGPMGRAVTGAERTAVVTLERARRQGADVLRETVETVKRDAAAGAKVNVRDALAQVTANRSTETVTVKGRTVTGSIRSIVDKVKGADAVTLTVSEHAAMVAALADLTALVGTLATVATPDPEPKPTGAAAKAAKAATDGK